MSSLIIACLISFYSIATLQAIDVSPDAGSPDEQEQLVEIFSTEDTPGEGSLDYKAGAELEKVTLGKEAGIFGLGMTFRGSLLPNPFRKDFTKNTIVQIAIGNLKSKLGNKMPQFGVATLITDQVPTKRTIFKFMVPENKQPKDKNNTAFLLFTSPATKTSQTDEEKLKSTYFAKSGTLDLVPIDVPSIVTVRTQGNKVTFKKQLMRVEIAAVLATPFNGVERELKGAVTFPFYWPHGKPAEQLTTRISGASLPGAQPGNPNRNVANQAKPKSEKMKKRSK